MTPHFFHANCWWFSPGPFLQESNTSCYIFVVIVLTSYWALSAKLYLLWLRDPLKVLKQSANNFFSDDFIAGRYGPLLSARRRVLFFAKFQNLRTNFFAAVLSIIPLCQRSFSLVSTQIREPCYESTKATEAVIYSWSPRFRFRTSISKLSLAMYPFSISLYEHVPLKFLMTKRLRKITKIYLPI